MPASESARAHVALLVFSMLVAGTYSLGSAAAPHIDATLLTALRFALSAVLMGLVVLLRYPPERRRIRQSWRYLVLGSVFAVYFVTLFEALEVTTAIATGAMFTLTPFVTAGFAWLLLRQPTRPRVLAALAVAAVGAVWVIFRGSVDALLGFELGAGERIFVVGVIAHALYVPLARLLDRGEPVPVFTFGMLVGGSIPLLALSAPQFIATDWSALPAIVWLTLGYVVVFASVITFLLLQYGNQRLPGTRVMAYTYLVPSWVTVWDAALGRGFVAPTVQIGIGLTVVAMLMLLRR